jgi:Uma2 family endonuclease
MSAVFEAPPLVAPPTDVLVTGEDLLRHPEWGPCELIRGKVVPLCRPNNVHGRLTARMSSRIDTFAELHNLGITFTDGGIFIEKNPDTVRGPNLHFVRADRCPPESGLYGYFEFAPDLCIEIVSPNDEFSKVVAKVMQYLGIGVRLVWVIDPATRLAHIYRGDRTTATVMPDSVLSGEDILP